MRSLGIDQTHKIAQAAMHKYYLARLQHKLYGAQDQQSCL